MGDILNSAINSVIQSVAAWCRFITGNDVGATGSHQAGFYIPKCASALLFEKPGEKGENKEKLVKIRWQDDFETQSCMKYYGQGTRNEYRITRFGRDFPFLQDENIGDLLIIAKQTETDYCGYVLSHDEDIESFFSYFNLAPDETNQLIDVSGIIKPEERLEISFRDFVGRYEDFPDTKLMALGARECYNSAYSVTENTFTTEPDALLTGWINTEFKLFKYMEEKVYAELVSKPFETVSSFMLTANKILNRRKSRAGKSLEYHLADIFSHNNLAFEEQVVTEDNKRPDFIFPNGKCYHDFMFPASELVVLGAKTTCKDRWRQVLTEADRAEDKYLFTLQPGISRNQLKEMQDSHLTLVVPKQIVPSFPIEYQDKIKDLAGFINYVRVKQEHLPRHYLMN